MFIWESCGSKIHSPILFMYSFHTDSIIPIRCIGLTMRILKFHVKVIKYFDIDLLYLKYGK